MLTPVITALGRAKAGGSLEVRSSGEILSVLKIQKISQLWWHVPVVPATQKTKVAWATEQDSV